MKYTIITINFNNEKGIEKTIESVYNQTCKDYEYIVIDGLSTDKSVEVANSYRDKFASKNIAYTIISEKDAGIYNAMNKGIDLANGDYINFMNSGDMFANENILQEIYNDMSVCDVYYGDSYVAKDNKIIDYRYATSVETMPSGIPFCHQASFVKTKVIKEYKFDEQYRISADFELYLRLYLDKKTFKQQYKFISIFERGGVSSFNSDEAKRIQQKYGIESPKPNKLKSLIRKFVPKWVITLKHKILRKRNK